MRLSRIVRTTVLLAAVALLPALQPAVADIVWTPDRGWQRSTETADVKADPVFDRAFASYVEAKYSKTRKLLDRVIKDGREPSLERARVLLAECYLGERHYTKAFEKFEDFIDAYPASPYVDRACRGEVEIAQAVLAGHKIRALGLSIWSGYSFGEKVVDKITSRRPLSDYARDAQLALARSYLRRRMYVESASAFQQYLELFGESAAAPEALLAVGRSLYLDAPGPRYDPLPYYRADAVFADFVRQYPASPHVGTARSLSAAARAKLAEHYLAVARYYLKVGSLDAAQKYFAKIVSQYGETRSAGPARSYLAVVPAPK